MSRLVRLNNGRSQTGFQLLQNSVNQLSKVR